MEINITLEEVKELKERNKFLSNIVRKHDQDLNGELFNKEILFSKKNDKKYLLKEFFLPFPRFDGRMGWAGEKNSTKAHHLAIIDDKVRPAVARDGGDIIFENFDKGVVYLTLKGACAGCPSSTATLKQGIENLLKHYFPEVKEVRAL